jgi:excisionase family DNA binding protein
MPSVMAVNQDRRLSTKEVADLAGVTRKTLLRWLKAGKIPEPDLDRNGWRTWTEEEAAKVAGYANKIVPHPSKRQTALDI